MSLNFIGWRIILDPLTEPLLKKGGVERWFWQTAKELMRYFKRPEVHVCLFNNAPSVKRLWYSRMCQRVVCSSINDVLEKHTAPIFRFLWNIANHLWDYTASDPRSWCLLGLLSDPEDEANMFLQNIGKLPSEYTKKMVMVQCLIVTAMRTPNERP
jgi:hypothetical protein